MANLQNRNGKTPPKPEHNSPRNGSQSYKSHFVQAVGPDSDGPLRTKDQFIVMAVILLFSAVLFSLLYFAALIFNKGAANPDGGQTVIAASDIKLPESSIAPVSDDSSVPGSDKKTSEPARDEKSGLVSNESTESSSEESSQSSADTEKSDESSENSREQKSSSVEISDHIEESSRKETSSLPSIGGIEYTEISNDAVYYGHLVLVNKANESKYDGENVTELINTRDSSIYGLSDAFVAVDNSIVDNVNAMFTDFHELYGDTNIMIACGYRSFSTQSELYDAEIDNIGNEQAELWVAKPGYSEHQTGLAFDLNLSDTESSGGIVYEGTENYSWINENCSRYGFIVRYPEGKENITGYEYEPWHLRYVGEAAAAYIHEEGITLEEYISIVHGCTVKSPLMINANGTNYCTYYIPAQSSGSTTLTIPEDHSYSVSGDNYSGFIITVDLDSERPESSDEADNSSYWQNDTDGYDPGYDPETTDSDIFYYE